MIALFQWKKFTYTFNWHTSVMTEPWITQQTNTGWWNFKEKNAKIGRGWWSPLVHGRSLCETQMFKSSKYSADSEGFVLPLLAWVNLVWNKNLFGNWKVMKLKGILQLYIIIKKKLKLAIRILSVFCGPEIVSL